MRLFREKAGLLDHAAEGAQVRSGSGLPAPWAGMQMGGPRVLLDEQVPAATGFKKPQVKGKLCPWARRLQLIQEFLVINRLRSLSKGTFLIDILNAACQGIGGHFAFIEPAQWLDLARQPIG